MKTARELMQHIADEMETLTDEDVTALFEARDAEWRAKVEQALIDGRQQALVQFLEWRGIEDQCVKCGGAGRRAYASTSTWHGGTGGSMVTDDVCDRCWGTGDQTKKGADLRRLQAQVEAAETKLAGIAAAAALAVKNEQWRIAAAEKRGEIAGLRKAKDLYRNKHYDATDEIEALIAKAEAP